MGSLQHPLSFCGALIALALLASELPAQTASRASLGSGGIQTNADSQQGALSSDGRWVVFMSYADNLVPGDTNVEWDVFLRDRVSGETTRVSVGTGNVQANDESYSIGAPAAGRYVCFESLASNLVPGDTNGLSDVFVHDRATGQTTRVSVTSTGVQANGPSARGRISEDGRYVCFQSFADNLVPGDTNDFVDVFLHDRQTGATERVSISSTGAQAEIESGNPSLSADGRFIAFFSLAHNLGASVYGDVFVRDRITGTTERVSAPTGGGEPDGYSIFPVISADGRYVAFESAATNLVTPDANGTAADILVHDRVAGTTERVDVSSNGVQADGACAKPSISPDGRFVTFASAAANLVPGDTNGVSDVFLRDRHRDITVRVSVGWDGGQASFPSFVSQQAVTADGHRSIFWCRSTLVLDDTNTNMDCFVRDLGPTFRSFCHGDGSGAGCPCGNQGQLGRGCDNSEHTGGALLAHSGSPVPVDTVVLDATGERARALTIFVQGDTEIAAVPYGDGLRCFGGRLKRLYVKSAVNGSATAPEAGDPSIQARSAAVGDAIPGGSTRFYMTYYRDLETSFCPTAGGLFNSSNALAIVW